MSRRNPTEGQDIEISEHAKLDERSAAVWLERREQAAAENAQRKQSRYGCLQNSAIVGAYFGLVGASLAWRGMRNPVGRTRFRNLFPSFFRLLDIDVSGKAIGGGGQSFVLFVSFFMPFVFVSNTVRWRCMKEAAGLEKNAPVPIAPGIYKR